VPGEASRELIEAHVRAFNHGVRTRDWEPMLSRFAEDAQLHFANVPAGPFVGLDEIRRSYRERPPDDEIALLGIQTEEGRATVAFAWRRGGTGRMILEHDGGTVTRLTIVFD
jgi:hypothetical protein